MGASQDMLAVFNETHFAASTSAYCTCTVLTEAFLHGHTVLVLSHYSYVLVQLVANLRVILSGEMSSDPNIFSSPPRCASLPRQLRAWEDRLYCI
jgi:hypothetical protein